MFEWLGRWVTSVTAAAVIVSCACAITHGAARRQVKFAGGLLLVVALLTPVVAVDVDDLSFYTQQYRAEYERYAEKHISTDTPQIKLIIESRSEAYILERAAQLGVECSVEVDAKRAENGYPYPSELTGRYAEGTDEEALTTLCRLVESELCIAQENQKWSEG